MEPVSWFLSTDLRDKLAGHTNASEGCDGRRLSPVNLEVTCTDALADAHGCCLHLLSDTHSTCSDVMLDHSYGSDPFRELPVAFTPRRLSMPSAHCGGRTPSILLPPMFLHMCMRSATSSCWLKLCKCGPSLRLLCGRDFVGLQGWLRATRRQSFQR